MKKLIILILIIAIAGGGIAYYMWNKPHQDMTTAATDFSMEASALLQAFEADETAANTMYLDKTIEVSGIIQEFTKADDGTIKVTLDASNPMSAVICELDQLSQHPRTEFTVGESVKFKGKCSGMLMDVVLTRCVEVN